MIRVLLVDDQALFRAGIRMLLASQPDLEVVGEANDGVQAIAQWRATRPDVILMDIRMPNMDGIEASAAILQEAVMADASWFSRGVIEKLALLRNPPPPGKAPVLVEKLTTRESDMLEGICRGASDEEIAADLGVSLNTIRNHVARLYRKIGVNRRSAVIVWARERGIGAATPNVRSRTNKLGQKH